MAHDAQAPGRPRETWSRDVMRLLKAAHAAGEHVRVTVIVEPAKADAAPADDLDRELADFEKRHDQG